MMSLIFAAGDPSFVVPDSLLGIALMSILVVVAFAIVRMRELFGVVMLQGVYSLVCAAWFVSLDAVDVAFTEAAVGAGDINRLDVVGHVTRRPEVSAHPDAPPVQRAGRCCMPGRRRHALRSGGHVRLW